MIKPELSLILPCYNEAEHFENSIGKILKVVQNCHIIYELIIIDDKSSDNTKSLIKKYIILHPNIPLKPIFHTKNMGRGYSVKEGMINAKGKYVGYIDIDCEASPKYIPIFIKELKKENDVVCGWRKYDFHINQVLRFIASVFYRWLSKKMLNHNLNDTESGYKFFNKKNILPILNKTINNHWFWDTEIMILSYKFNLKIKEVEIDFIRDPNKTSTVRLIPDTINYLKSLFLFRKYLIKQKI